MLNQPLLLLRQPPPVSREHPTCVPLLLLLTSASAMANRPSGATDHP